MTQLPRAREGRLRATAASWMRWGSRRRGSRRRRRFTCWTRFGMLFRICTWISRRAVFRAVRWRGGGCRIFERTVYIAGGVLALVGSPIAGRLADRFGKLLVYRVVAPLLAVMFVVATNLPEVSLAVAALVMAL